MYTYTLGDGHDGRQLLQPDRDGEAGEPAEHDGSAARLLLPHLQHVAPVPTLLIHALQVYTFLFGM